MSAPLHMNLIKEEEVFSSSPIRLRVMLPLFGIVVVVVALLSWATLELNIAGLNHQKNTLTAEIATGERSHKDILRLRTEKAEYGMTLQQIASYTNSCARWGDTLAAVAPVVSSNIQLTAMNIISALPPQPPVDKAQLANWHGPTNLTESVSMLIEGKAYGAERDDAISSLLKSLQSPAFSNRIESAVILKGDVRQDTLTRDVLLFKITCTVRARRFE